MDMAVVAQFAIAMALPVAASAALVLLRRSTGASKLPDPAWQVVVGVVFGAVAIYGTEFGIPLDGAMMNVRDAAPLAAGLLFGGPAGIIAGVIGGVERWLAVMWGVGAFTRVACSLGTIFAGVYAALLRKFLFERHVPNLAFAFASGIVVEVLHLMLVFVTNPDDPVRAFQIVRACAVPMTICVGLSMLMCSMTVTLIERRPLITPPGERNVARILHARMLVAVAAAFFATVGFTWLLQTTMARTETARLLDLNITDVERDIRETSDANLLDITRQIASSIPVAADATNEECARLTAELDIAEINVVGPDGTITASSNPQFVGFDMASGEQSAGFLTLLPDGGASQIVQDYQPIAYNENVWRKYAGLAVEGGFVQAGYDSSSFHDDLASQVDASVQNRHVGQTGMLVAINEAGTATSTRNEVGATEAAQLVDSLAAATPGEIFPTQFAGQDHFALYRQIFHDLPFFIPHLDNTFSACHAPVQKLGKPVNVIGSENKIHKTVLSPDLFNFVLFLHHAAADADDLVRVFPFHTV